MTSSLNLADDQRFALMKLRRNIKDVLQPHHDDIYLVRWLIARKWDVPSAEKMLRESLEWRKKWDVDKMDDYEIPKILKDHLPIGLTGFDKTGCPVYVMPYGGFDIYGLIHAVPETDFIKTNIKFLEDCAKICREQVKKHGPQASQNIFICDMENFNFKQFFWTPARDFMVRMTKMQEANYPEIIKVLYVLNAPKIFAVVYSIMKKFMAESTILKTQILTNDPEKWKTALLEHIEPDQIPKYYGGTLTDPDGNPKLITKVCQGGKVPKSMYKNNIFKEKSNIFTNATVKKGDKLILDYKLEVGWILSWEFRTDNHDIKFGVIRKTDDGTESELIPVSKVTCHEVEEIGVINCEVPGVYSIVFDNSYSILQSKKLYYSIQVTPPATEVAGQS